MHGFAALFRVWDFSKMGQFIMGKRKNTDLNIGANKYVIQKYHFKRFCTQPQKNYKM